MMRNKAHMLGLMALAMMESQSSSFGSQSRNRWRDYEPPETDDERKLRLVQAEIKRHKANGLKEFVYGGNSLYARDQKNADRKARNRNWL